LRISSRCRRSDRAIFFMGSMRERMVLTAPLIEEFRGPGGRVVIPELLKGLLKKVSADGPQVVPEQIAQAETLFSFRFSSRLSRSQRDFFSSGVRPSLAMRRDSPARTSSRALFIFATIWKRSRICRASEHFSLVPRGAERLGRFFPRKAGAPSGPEAACRRWSTG
jgi:hypothetical protein